MKVDGLGGERHGTRFWNDERESGNAGLKILEKMGWKVGECLGTNSSGSTEYVKAHKKADNKGIGSKSDSRDEVWLASQDMFGDILNRLNAENSGKTIPKNDKTTKSVHAYMAGRQLRRYNIQHNSM